MVKSDKYAKKNSAAVGIYGGFTVIKIRQLIRRAVILPADFRRTNFRRWIRRSAAAEGSIQSVGDKWLSVNLVVSTSEVDCLCWVDLVKCQVKHWTLLCIMCQRYHDYMLCLLSVRNDQVLSNTTTFSATLRLECWSAIRAIQRCGSTACLMDRQPESRSPTALRQHWSLIRSSTIDLVDSA